MLPRGGGLDASCHPSPRVASQADVGERALEAMRYLWPDRFEQEYGMDVDPEVPHPQRQAGSG